METALLALDSALAVSVGYLLVLLWAARGGERDRRRSARRRSDGRVCAQTEREARSRLVVLIPAHDEELGIAETLSSLRRSDYRSDLYRTVVIADNCSDATASCARAQADEVWERVAPAERGKGYALGWALARLERSRRPFDAVVVLDADCVVSANMLSAIDQTLRSGASAVQVSYCVGNPAASRASALRFAAFALMDTVRPLGKERLGLSCGLFGTGMAFTRELLRRAPWSAVGLAEDGEYHLRLVAAGERVEFIPHAWVRSAMPTSLRASREQQARWERGRLGLIRRWTPSLVASGVARRDPVRVHAGLEHLVAPQSLLAAGSLGCGVAGLALGSGRIVRLAFATASAQLAFVLGGLRLAGAPPDAYRALASAPFLVAGKVALYGRLLAGRGPASWIRTERELPLSPDEAR